MQSEAPVLSGGAAAVAKAWPALAAERDGLAPVAALAGLDVALVREVVASLARRRPPARPGHAAHRGARAQGGAGRLGVTSKQAPLGGAVARGPVVAAAATVAPRARWARWWSRARRDSSHLIAS